MLNENIRAIRKNRGYSQEELAIRLHVTRQTISKWEKGLSVPDSMQLSDMAEIFEVSASELLGEASVEEQDHGAVVEQLSRINEQLAIRNRRASRIIKVLGVILLVLITPLITIAIAGVFSDLSQLTISDHIGNLTYSLPASGFVHDKDDVGITVEKDGRERICAKIYKKHSDMTEISIWEYNYDQELLTEFKEEHKDDLVEHTRGDGILPEAIDEVISATDATDDYIGRYYKAFVVTGEKMYCVEVQNGDDPKGNGELLIASMDINNDLSDEYR